MDIEAGNSHSEVIAIPSNIDFSMGANGFFRDGDGWRFNPDALRNTKLQFDAQQVSFFGPSDAEKPFFMSELTSPGQFAITFRKPGIAETIEKYRRIDAPLAHRTAYLLGGIIRQLTVDGIHSRDIQDAVEFASRVAKLGEGKSGDAITSAISLYLISGGSTRPDKDFNGWVYRMSEAIRDDQIIPRDTHELGLSQVARLRGFKDRLQGDEPSEMPDLRHELELFDEFPTVGAEFHIPLKDPDRARSFWKRLALLNMSQYQRESHIQMSRTDKGVVEVRMNPSVYPVTIANWEHIKSILPEIQGSFYWITLNRRHAGADFNWGNADDANQIRKLRDLGLLTYAATHDSTPGMESNGEIDFGEIYLGQTVRVKDGGYDFSGQWNGKQGKNGQLSIYAGFGNNLPHLAYYLSMAMVNPEVVSRTPLLGNNRPLTQAVDLASHEKESLFSRIHREIEKDPRLSMATRTGRDIVRTLRS